MIRRVYIDFVRQKLSEGRFAWLARTALRYPLIHLSQLAGRPLCGPILGTLVTNYTCNYRCSMCDLPRRDSLLRDSGLEPFSSGQMLQVIDAFADLGTLGIGFTGGEPLLRADIYQLLERCRERGMLTHLNTNGSMLDAQAARRILETQVDSVNVSLDGATAATHDLIRGVVGAFDRAVSGVGILSRLRRERGARLRLKVVAVLGAENISEISDLMRLAEDLDVDCLELIPRQPFGAGEEAGSPPAREDTAVAVEELTRPLLAGPNPIPLENSPRMLGLFGPSFRGEPSPLRCYAGYNSLTVDCYGRVFPCLPWLNWDRSASVMAGTDLRSVWNSGDYGERRREASRCRDCYLNCQAELNLLFNPLRRIPAVSR